MLRLVNAGPSPFGRKVMVALHEKEIPFELQWDIPWHGDTVTPDLNPLEQLPILIAETGEAVYESSYILEWLEVHYPERPLLPFESYDRLAARAFRVLAVGVMDAFQRMNFEYARPSEHRSSAWIDRHLRKVRGGLSAMNSRIYGKTYAVGNKFSLADVEAGCVLGHLDFIAANVPPLKSLFNGGFNWRAENPALSSYTDEICLRPSFKASEPFMVSIDFASVVA